jgi:putative ATP-dependent endonuclease of the OLD family
MKLKSLRIQNLRSFSDEIIPFNDYTCLIGPNGSGKSTVLYALNVLFRNTTGPQTDVLLLTEEDFHNRNTSRPIKIEVHFTDLSEDERIDFANYYRQGQLIIAAVANFDVTTGTAAVQQVGVRMVYPAFAGFFKALGDGAAVAQLKTIYKELRAEHADLEPAATKVRMLECLKQFEGEHAGDCEPLESADQFYGFTKGANRLAKYVQWVYVPAVKDATTENVDAKGGALNKLLDRTVRARLGYKTKLSELQNETIKRYRALLADDKPILGELAAKLEKRIQEWAHPGVRLRLDWRQDGEQAVRIDEPAAEVLIGERGFEGYLGRFGHGLQRSYLLALLQELAESGDAPAPMLILGCEEPELYQHPPQAHHLSDVLQELSRQSAQVVVCTHSPAFISGGSFEDIRLLRYVYEDGATRLRRAALECVAKRVAEAGGRESSGLGARSSLHQALQPELNEMFFASVLVLTEGLEDMAFITTCMHVMKLWREFRRLGCHMVCSNGKSQLILPLSIARELEIPTFTVFDGDDQREDKNGRRQMHQLDNETILRLCGVEEPVAFPASDYWGHNVVMWKDEIGKAVAEDVGVETYRKICEGLSARYGFKKNLKKNVLFIGDVIEECWRTGCLPSRLEQLCKAIIAFGEKARAK